MEGSSGSGRCGRLVRAMTRCECAELSFDELAGQLRRGRSFDEVQAESGAGLLCTACLPDLHEHLAAAGEAQPRTDGVRSCVPDDGAADDPEADGAGDSRLAGAADPR